VNIVLVAEEAAGVQTLRAIAGTTHRITAVLSSRPGMRRGATVADVADSVHHELGASFSGARVWGPSARFEGQRVGREHAVQDRDTVEILR